MTRLLIGLFILASAGEVIPEYFGIGFRHVLPLGLDHVLFVLGLFFLTKDFSVLLFQLTLFTLAHSLTLGLALYGVISVPTTLVEVAIALSISFIAIENLFCNGLSRWRPWVVFAFGLVHGLGFAHSFQEHAVDIENFLPALFSFNVGIECAQIVVVGMAYTAVAVWWKRETYRLMVARPASVMLAASGLYWAVERSI